MSNSNPSANTATARFVSTAKTAEDLLSKQTEGLVNLSDFRKRRAEALEAKERGLQSGQDALLLKDGGGSGGSGENSRDGTPDGASTPQSLMPKKKKRKVAGKVKMSFGSDEEGETKSPAADTPIDSTSTSRSNTPGTQSKPKKFTPNSSVAAPKALTKSALLREAQEREMLRKEFLAIQERVKATEISIPFVFYDGTNIPGGICRISKGDFIWVFLDRSRKVGAELGVGEKANSRREWARIGVDDLMLVRGTIIIPHHYDFYYFIINHTLGPNNRLLFDYSADPPSTSSTPKPTEEINLDNYNPLSLPSKNKGPAEKKNEVDEKSLEGANDDPTYTKVVDRRWYERNKHIFPASVWQEFDPEKNYQSEVKRDAGGNAFFFS